MDVLKAIHTNDSQATSLASGDRPLSELKSGSVCVIVDDDDDDDDIASDDEDKAERKRKQFVHRLSAFSYESVTPAHRIECNEVSKSGPRERKIKRPASPIHPPIRQILPEDDAIMSSTTTPSSLTSKGPIKLSDSLIPTLRTFINCPLCLLPFPKLSFEEEAATAKKGKAVTKRSKAKTKKPAPQKKNQTGPERLLHVEICAFRNVVPENDVSSLIARERVRLDKNRRLEYNEGINNEPVWKTLTGDEPPNTQAQQDSLNWRKRAKYTSTTVTKGKQKEVNKAKAKASKKGGKAKASVSFKAGKRGGYSKASTTILAPHLTRNEVKRRCIELFGPQATLEDQTLTSNTDIWSLYDHHEENTSRCRAALASAKRAIVLGLGVGACSLVKEEGENLNGAIARLDMGNTLGNFIAQRYKSSS